MRQPLTTWTTRQLSAVIRRAALTINPRNDVLLATRAAGEAAADNVCDLDMNGAMVARWSLEQWAKFCKHEGFALKLTGVVASTEVAPLPVPMACQLLPIC